MSAFTPPPRSRRALAPFLGIFALLASCWLVASCTSDGLLLPFDPPTVTSVTGATGLRGTTARVTITGTGFVPAGTTVAFGGAGLSLGTVTLGESSITADVVISAAADLGAHEVRVTTPGGTVLAGTFVVTVPPPTLTSVSPSVVIQGGAQTVTLVGTDFLVGATSVAVSGSGVTVSGVTVTGSTSLTANLSIAASATLGARGVTVTTAGGTSAARTLTVNPPPPVLQSVTPSTGVRGTAVAVTLTGTSFISGATSVAVSGSDVAVDAVTVSSSTSLTATFTIGSGAALGARDVIVTTAGGTSSAQPFTVLPPAPTLTSVTPGEGKQGTTVSVTLAGANFIADGTIVAVSGAGVSVARVAVSSATTLTADFAIAVDAALGARQVTVTTAGGVGGAQTFTVLPPTPTLASVTPSTGLLGANLTLTLTGTNFISGGTSVGVSGTGVAATSVVVTSATTLSAQIAIAAGASLGARQLTVTTAGGTSGSQTFTVLPFGPTLTSVIPANGRQGATVSVTLTGTNFVAGAGGSTVDVSGAGVTVTNVSVTSSTTLTADFAIATGAATGARDVTVTTSGGTTAAQPFTVVLAIPTLASVAPSTGAQGGTASVTLTGTGFVTGATTVAVSGAGVTVSNVSVSSPTSLTADLAVAYGADLGAHDVTVTTGGGTSGTQAFTVTATRPVLTGVSPNTGAQGGSRSVTLTGTGFVPGATTVEVSGANVTPSGISVANSTSLTATFTTDIGAAVGPRDVTVRTNAGQSAPQTFTVIAGPSITTFAALATHVTVAQPSQMVWTTSNATSCSIDNSVGSVGCSTSAFVTPGTTKTYTLSASSAGATVTANVTIFANEPGRWVYWSASGGSSSVRENSLDGTTGDLTAIGTGSVAVANTPRGVVVDPAGKFAYVARFATDNVSMFTIDATTGALTANGTVAAGNEPSELAVDPTGRYAYVLNGNTGGAGSVSSYTINGSGQLVGNGSIAVGNAPRGIVVDPTGRWVYVTNRSDKTLSMLAINPDGTLASLGTITTSGLTPYLIAVDPTGRFLYVTHDTQGQLSQYSIGSDGTLTALGLIGLTGTMRAVTADPTGRFLYAVDYNNSIIHEFSIDQTTGILTRFAAPTLPHTLPTTQTVDHMAIDPQGKFAYMTDDNVGEILIFSIDANGVLAPVAAPLRTVAGGTSPFGIAVSR